MLPACCHKQIPTMIITFTFTFLQNFRWNTVKLIRTPMKAKEAIRTRTHMKQENMATLTKFGPMQARTLIEKSLSTLVGIGKSGRSQSALEGIQFPKLTNLAVLLGLVVSLLSIYSFAGKTALMLALCKTLYPKYNIAALTNDIFTEEVYAIQYRLIGRTESSS